jgi:hypothetical protein
LGRYDGQVYEALLERARLNPTNRHKVNQESFYERKKKSIDTLGSSNLGIDKARDKIQALDFSELVFEFLFFKKFH